VNVLLFSGGIDSTAIAYWIKPDVLLFVDYGQVSAQGERRSAIQISKELEIDLEIVEIDARPLGSGDLAGTPSIKGKKSEFWPFRNQFLITIAAMQYANKEPVNILIGTVSSDVIHPDGRNSFIRSLNETLCSQGKFSLDAPAIGLTSRELIKTSRVSQNILGWTFSCHVAEHACGQCRGCIKHYEELSAV